MNDHFVQAQTFFNTYLIIIKTKKQRLTLILQSQLAVATAVPSGDTCNALTRLSCAYKIDTRTLFKVSHIFTQ